MNINDIRTDATKVNEGVWIDYPGGCSFRVCQIGNKAMRAAIRKTIADGMDAESASSALESMVGDDPSDLAIRLMATYVVVDWKDITNNDEPLPYSVENAVMLFSDEGLDELRMFILAKAASANFKAEVALGKLKRSPSSSSRRTVKRSKK